MGLVPARVLGGQAFGFSPPEELKFRRQMATAVGNNASVSPVLFFMEVNDLGLRRSYPPLPRSFWAEGVRMGRWRREQQKAWRKQIIFEVQA